MRPTAYARTRNALDGAVSGLSPYITHGFVTLADVLAGVAARHALDVRHKFVFELGWRAYFRHVWQHRGEGILYSLHEGPLPDEAYARVLPADIRQGCTGVPVVDEAVRALYATGTLHNHARMWLASYVVHVRKVHWRVAADWLYGHLLDGDLASNHLSWQWVAGTASRKPYLFNADNVARYASASWHSPGSVIDASYEALDRMARQPAQALAHQPVPQRYSDDDAPPGSPAAGRAAPWRRAAKRTRLDGPRRRCRQWPRRLARASLELGQTAGCAAGRHAWCSASSWPTFIAPGRGANGAGTSSAARMAELAVERWHGDAASIGAALKGARSVRSIDEPHLSPWLARWAECVAGARAVSGGRSALRLLHAMVGARLTRPELGRGPDGRQRGVGIVANSVNEPAQDSPASDASFPFSHSSLSSRPSKQPTTRTSSIPRRRPAPSRRSLLHSARPDSSKRSRARVPSRAEASR